jgi:hypothetical protein
MRMLELGSRGADADTMIAHASRYWEAGQAGGHIKKLDAGMAQAERIEPYFRAVSAVWCKSVETAI